jgi:hypothetical protein
LPILLVCILIAIPAQLIVHECGQLVLARLMGDPDATLRSSEWRVSGGMRVWSAEYDTERLVPLGRVLVPLAGLLFTQSVALGMLAVSARWPVRSRAYAAVAAASFGVDLVVQLGRAVVASATGVSGAMGFDLENAARAMVAVWGLHILVSTAILWIAVGAWAFGFWRVVRRRLRGRSWAA